MRIPNSQSPAQAALIDLGITDSPGANTARPAALIFLAALTSRSWPVLHSGHTQYCVSVYPQQLQRFEEGKNWSMATTERPDHSALYCNWRTNSPQLASAIALDIRVDNWDRRPAEVGEQFLTGDKMLTYAALL